MQLIPLSGKDYLNSKALSVSLFYKGGGGAMFALLFLLWGGVLVLLSPDKSTALIAMRYLGFGFVIFLIMSRLIHYFGTKWKNEVFYKFSKLFVCSCVGSVLFGTWAEFVGGFDVLQNFYSTTISSWVPGQTLPLYHKASGVIRMQGGSSGPVAFAHLMMIGFFLCLYSKSLHSHLSLKSHNSTSVIHDNKVSLVHLFQMGRAYFLKWGLVLILIFGIYQSASRAAILGLVVGVVIWIIIQDRMKNWRGIIIGLILGIIAGGMYGIYQNEDLQKKIMQRSGTVAHFTKPIEAIQKGLEYPIIGNLGKLGPAARSKNLRENNDDKALIAENVFADYFAQLGIIGLVMSMGFFVTVFRWANRGFWPICAAIFVTINLATVFDMTPVAILFFVIISFFEGENMKF